VYWQLRPRYHRLYPNYSAFIHFTLLVTVANVTSAVAARVRCLLHSSEHSVECSAVTPLIGGLLYTVNALCVEQLVLLLRITTMLCGAHENLQLQEEN